VIADNNIIKISIEEGILDTELTNRPRTRENNVDNKADSSSLDNWNESHVVGQKIDFSRAL
jgi:hypothetical protein